MIVEMIAMSEKLYRSCVGKIEEWDVIEQKPRTVTIARSLRGHHDWTKSIRKSHIGKQYFTTVQAAIEHELAERQAKVDQIKGRLHQERTYLGMTLAALKRLKKPASVDAVARDSEEGKEAPRA